MRSNKKRKSRQAKARKTGFPKPDIFLDKVNLRHAADKQDLLPKMEKSLRTEGWNGRPLLVLSWQGKNGDKEYETVTGCHRAQAAMNVGVPIPCVLIPKMRFRNANTMEYRELASLLLKARLRKAAKLVRLEIELGSTAKPILPTKRPPTLNRKFTLTRFVDNPQEPNDPQP